MTIFSVLVLLAGLSLMCRSAEAIESFNEYGESKESISSCVVELNDPSCETDSPDQVIGLPPAGYNQFVHDPGSKWYIDPCRHVGKLLDVGEYVPDDADLEELLIHVTNEANRSLTLMKAFIPKFIEQTYHVDDYEVFKDYWQSNCYDWLPSHKAIPKNFGEPLPAEYLATIDKNMKSLTLNASIYMRLYGYALDHFLEAQNKSNAIFAADFANAVGFHLRLQCDLEAVVEVYSPEITDLPYMELKFLKDTNNQVDSLRDWIILREYMNALEWFIESFSSETKFLRSFEDTVADK